MTKHHRSIESQNDPQMKQSSIYQIICIALAIICCCCGIGTPVMAQEKLTPEEVAALADSARQLRKEYRDKKTWEHLVSLPGTIVSLPLVIVAKTTETVAGFIYEEKLIPRTIEFFTSADGRRGITPKYSNRSGAGAKVYQTGILSENDQLSFTASGDFSQRQRYRIEWKRIQLANAPLLLNFRAQYRNLPEEDFYGIGPHTRYSDELEFDFEYTAVEGGIQYLMNEQLSVGFLGRFDHSNVYPEDQDGDEVLITDLYDRNSLPGLQTKVRTMEYQAELNWDSRNRLGNPSSGQEALFSAAIFRDVDNGPFNFRKFRADVSQYIHLGANRVIRLRLAGEMTEPESDTDRAPFYNLSELGEQESIRGFERGRFRDFDSFLASLEYRVPIWRKMDIFAFADAGQVDNDIFSDLNTKKMQFGFGGGVRLFSEKDLVAVGQIGISKETFRVYFELY